MKDRYDPADKTSGAAKLTEDLVREYRQAYWSGKATVRGIAAAQGMGTESVRRMLRGETWAWVKANPPKTDDELAREANEIGKRLMAAFAPAGQALTAAVEVQEELGIPVSDEVKRKAAFLTGRGGGEDSGN